MEIPPTVAVPRSPLRRAIDAWNELAPKGGGNARVEFFAMPDKAIVQALLKRAAAGAEKASNTPLAFDKLLKLAQLEEANWWQGETSLAMRIPIAQSGAKHVLNLTLGIGTAHHALLIGQTGSGKTNLMHVLITSIALAYSPREAELFLIDFKGGVGFKQYAVNQLPHARVIAIESEREFGISVLEGLQSNLKMRQDMFRSRNVETLAEFRKAVSAPLPRLFLIVDEFQEFFREDDALSQKAKNIFDLLVRQGRSFGIHVLLSTQSLSGTGALPGSIKEQMGIRIVLKCGENDYRQVLSEDNTEARQLARPGEGIYNDGSGALEANKRFLAPLFDDAAGRGYLQAVRAKAERENNFLRTIVFEGSQPARLESCRWLAELSADAERESKGPAQIYLGEPVALKPPEKVLLGRQSGRHLLALALNEADGMGVLLAAWISLLAQVKHGAAQFIVFSNPPPETEWADLPQAVAAAFPKHAVEFLNRRSLGPMLQALKEEVRNRLEHPAEKHPPVYFVILGIQRARDLRADDASALAGAPAGSGAPSLLSEMFFEILRDGPEAGVHVLASGDSLPSVSRVLARSLREFGIRAAGAMSAEDSTAFIGDDSAARITRPHRVIVMDEERPGALEKMRCYAPPALEWLEGVRMTNV